MVKISDKVVNLYRSCNNCREFMNQFESDGLAHSRGVYKFLEQIEPKPKIKYKNNQPNLF